MSINAHLIKKINIKTNNEDIRIEKIIERDPTFNTIKHWKLFELIRENNGDNTNIDLNGEITIDKESWKKILKKILKDETTPEELQIIEKISCELENNEYIQFECI